MDNILEKRLDICKNCAIMRITEFGMKCDDRKWLDPVNNVCSFFKKEGYIKGCGCYCNKKASNPANHCIAKKW